MNCSQCGKDIVLDDCWLVSPPIAESVYLCSEHCLRAWLAPDRPIYEPVEQAQNAANPPQPIVVCHHNQIDPLGESQWRCVKCLKEFTEYPLAQLR